MADAMKNLPRPSTVKRLSLKVKHEYDIIFIDLFDVVHFFFVFFFFLSFSGLLLKNWLFSKRHS